MPDLTEHQQTVLLAALKLAANQYYEEAWAFYGPHGTRPDRSMHATMMKMGDDVREVGRLFGEPMD